MSAVKRTRTDELSSSSQNPPPPPPAANTSTNISPKIEPSDLNSDEDYTWLVFCFEDKSIRFVLFSVRSASN